MENISNKQKSLRLMVRWLNLENTMLGEQGHTQMATHSCDSRICHVSHTK